MTQTTIQPAPTTAPEPVAFDCPGNYQALNPTSLRCSKCNRPLATKDAKRTPTGYVCPYFVKARLATFYNAKPIHYVVAGAIAIVGGVVTGLAMSLVSSIAFLGIILMIAVAPAIGGGVAEVIRRVLKKMNNARGQYIWLAAAICLCVGAAPFTVLPAVAAVVRFSPSSIYQLIPLIGLGIAVSTLVARMRF